MTSSAIILLGPPGCGKGSVSKSLTLDKKYLQISTGDMLREEIKLKTNIGLRVQEIMNAGNLVSDELIIEMVEKRIDKQNNTGEDFTFLFDGYPRTTKQAEMLNQMLSRFGISLNEVFLINVPLEVIIKRITERRLCPTCNKIYNLTTMPPANENHCDQCGVTLIQRDDDREEKVINRYTVYNEMTKPIFDYYQNKIIKIDGTRNIDLVVDDIRKHIEK